MMAFGENIVRQINRVVPVISRHFLNWKNQCVQTNVKSLRAIPITEVKCNNFLNTDTQSIKIVTPQKPNPGVSGMWSISSHDVTVASDWLKVQIPPKNRGKTIRTSDGRVGIFVGTDSSGKEVLCQEPQRFYHACQQFDNTLN